MRDIDHQHQHQHGDGDGTHAHTHGTVSEARPDTAYNWQIYHPFDDIEDRVAVEVSPWTGLLPRWRFVIPAQYEGVVTWGIGETGTRRVDHGAVRRPVSEGPVQLKDGPLVQWLGGHNALSVSLGAIIVFEGEPPHYLAFGQAREPDGPPESLEGIYFQAHQHPDPHDSHGPKS